MNTKTALGYLVLLVICVIGVFFVRIDPPTDSEYQKTTITIAGKAFTALVSDTDSLRERGLGGRKGLGSSQAMLFVFDKPDIVGFWMKDMKFSIDILWLDSQYRVVSFEKSVSPDTYPKVFFPKGLSRYVIELPAGSLADLALKEGDQASVSGGK